MCTLMKTEPVASGLYFFISVSTTLLFDFMEDKFIVASLLYFSFGGGGCFMITTEYDKRQKENNEML